jgi:hypothetical protein
MLKERGKKYVGRLTEGSKLVLPSYFSCGWKMISLTWITSKGNMGRGGVHCGYAKRYPWHQDLLVGIITANLIGEDG